MSHIKLQLFSNGSGCLGGTCPAAFKSEDGRFFIRGNKVTNEIKNDVKLEASEDIIEVSEEFLKKLAAKIK